MTELQTNQGNQMIATPFAKLFEIKDFGQVLVTVGVNEENEPVVTFSCVVDGVVMDACFSQPVGASTFDEKVNAIRSNFEKVNYGVTKGIVDQMFIPAIEKEKGGTDE